jgi:hypothetical protein
MTPLTEWSFDRLLADMAWSQHFLQAECKVLAIPMSDRTTLLLTTDTLGIKHRIFRYENHWCQTPKLLQVNKAKAHYGNMLDRYIKDQHKLHAVRAATREWSR